MTLTPDQGTTFNISRTELTGSKCAVCSGGGLRKSCSSSVVLRGPEATAVEFTCPHPEELFTVRVCRDIGTMFVLFPIGTMFVLFPIR